MRFESIEVMRYGCLADLSTGDAPLPNIVVVLGPNESGKSTLFDFMSTILYGFRPATRSRHPFTPWAGGDPEGRATIRLDLGEDSSPIEVHRRLRSQAWGRLHAAERVDDIRNRPVPGVAHVTRVVFRQVYALTLAELAGLERESWDLVQDRLVGAMAAPDLVSARTVAADLEAEAKRLWRPDRRGRPRVRALAEELSRLNERKRDALYNDRVVRDKVAERTDAERRLRALREERARVEVRDAEDRVARLERRRREAVAAGTEGERLEARVAEHAGELFGVPPDEVDREALAAVPVEELRGRVLKFKRAREERRVAEESLRSRGEAGLPATLKPGKGRLGTGILLLLLGIAVAAVTMPQVGVDLPLSNAVALRVGAVAAIGGFILMILWWDADRRARQYRRASSDAKSHLSGKAMLLKDAEAAARAGVTSLVAGLPIRDSLLTTPDVDLPAAIERMRELLDNRERHTAAARRDLEHIDDDLGAAHREHEAAVARLRELDVPEDDPGRGAGGRAGQRDALADQAEELRGTIARLDTEIAHLQEGDTPDRIEGRIEAVKQQIHDAKEGRDRSFVLARLVREADRRFRDDHQPDLLRRAGDHLRHITAGRYEHIEMGETGDESLYLSGPAASAPRKVGEALSQGTREQVYLALRLAIIDHLDAGEERLPLFMDETLVNWDAWRRDRAFGLLERVAEQRQVFVFTCHPAMAAELEDRDARIIALGGG